MTTSIYYYDIKKIQEKVVDLRLLDPDIAEGCLATLENTTILGCHIYGNTLYLACFNINEIIEIDLITKGIVYRYNISSPNDVCADDRYIYAVGGTAILGVNYPTLGCIYRIDKRTSKITTFMSGFTSLAGIRMYHNNLYVSRLFDIVTIDIETKKLVVISDCVDNGLNYLSDNITVVNNKLYVSLYRIIDNDEMLKLRVVPSTEYFVGTITSQIGNRTRGQLSYPEHFLEFSVQDKMEKISYMIINEDDSFSFKHIKKIENYDGHVTQICEIAPGIVLAANFKEAAAAIINLEETHKRKYDQALEHASKEDENNYERTLVDDVSRPFQCMEIVEDFGKKLLEHRRENIKKWDKTLATAYIKNSSPLLYGSEAEWSQIINQVEKIANEYKVFLNELEARENARLEYSYLFNLSKPEYSSLFNLQSQEFDEEHEKGQICEPNSIESVQNQHEFWKARIAWYKAKRAECVACKAGVDARAEARRTPSLLSRTEQSLQQNSLSAEEVAKNTFEEAVNVFIVGLESAESSHPHLVALRFPWIKTLQNLTTWNSPNNKDKLFYKLRKDAIKKSLVGARKCIPSFPHEIQSFAAFRAANEACKEYVKVLDDNSLENRWQNVYVKVTDAFNSWRKVLDAIINISPEIGRHLKEWVMKEESITNRYVTDWNEILLWQFNPFAPSDAPAPTVDNNKLSLLDLREFPFASLKESKLPNFDLSNYNNIMSSNHLISSSSTTTGTRATSDWDYFRSNVWAGGTKAEMSAQYNKWKQQLPNSREDILKINYSINSVTSSSEEDINQLIDGLRKVNLSQEMSISRKILKTVSGNPYILIEELIDLEGNICNREKMVADVLLLSLKEEMDLDTLHESLISIVSTTDGSLELSVESVTPYQPLYRVHVKSSRASMLDFVSETAKSFNEVGYSCTYDELVSLTVIPNDTEYTRPGGGLRWNFDNRGIRADEGWIDRRNASDIIVAIIDTGILDTHEDLVDNMLGNTSGSTLNDGAHIIHGCSKAVDDEYTEWNATDTFGHGTQVAGVVGACGNNDIGIAGVAWNVRLMACKYSNTRYGELSRIIACINYALGNNAHIINLSFDLLPSAIKAVSTIKYYESQKNNFIDLMVQPQKILLMPNISLESKNKAENSIRKCEVEIAGCWDGK
eukprot:gene8657-11700_t